MIKREDLVAGAKFTQSDEATNVEILAVGGEKVFLRHSNGVENLWGISSCLYGLKPVPPPKKKGTVYLHVYLTSNGTILTSSSPISKASGTISNSAPIAYLEVPWEEGQGIE